jgi:sugar transferase (PEP-CTERM system associated)
MGASSLLVEMAERGEIDAAVIAITHRKSPELFQTMIKSKLKGVEICDMPSLYEEYTGKVPVMHITDGLVAYTPFQGMKKTMYMRRVKGLLDKALSLTGLTLSLPMMAVTAAAIKLDSRGPVLYRQRRVGLDGRTYELLKFRSMTADAETKGAQWARENDPRVTRVGRFIRKTRIDEIPQMWNVLNGQMSFIGPRPERPEFVSELNHEIPFYTMRHSVKPGITGWAQVNYRYGASKGDALEKLQYDLFYIKNLSALLDLHIILRTIRVVLFGTGAR